MTISDTRWASPAEVPQSQELQHWEEQGDVGQEHGLEKTGIDIFKVLNFVKKGKQNFDYDLTAFKVFSIHTLVIIVMGNLT